MRLYVGENGEVRCALASRLSVELEVPMRIGSSWALFESYGALKFVTPFEDLDGVVGRHFYDDWVQSHGGKIRQAPRGAGIVASLDQLASDAFDPSVVHPLVRDLYEHTSLVKFIAKDIVMTWLGWVFHYPYNKLVARGMQQLDVPLDPGLLPRRITSDVSFFDKDGDGDVDWRIWLRGYEGMERFFYVCTVHTHRVEGRRGSQTYLDVNLPLWQACLSVVFQPVNLPNGGLSLRTKVPGSYQAGMHVVFPGPRRFSMMPALGLHEEIRVSPRVDQNGEESVNGLHITSWGPWTMYEIHYSLLRPDAASTKYMPDDVSTPAPTSPRTSHA